jgi:hypothetical protein
VIASWQIYPSNSPIEGAMADTLIPLTIGHGCIYWASEGSMAKASSLSLAFAYSRLWILTSHASLLHIRSFRHSSWSQLLSCVHCYGSEFFLPMFGSTHSLQQSLNMQSNSMPGALSVVRSSRIDCAVPALLGELDDGYAWVVRDLCMRSSGLSALAADEEQLCKRPLHV